MPVTQNLYQIYKLTSTQIVEAQLNIQNYTRLQAIREGTLVSIGDNMVFQKIRDYYGDTRTHLEIFEKNQELRTTLRKCKKAGKIPEAKIVNQCLSDLLFVKDIINVEVEKKTDYKKLAKDGFYVNGIKYIRFLAGAGQIRRNTATFINVDLYDYVYEALMCGLDKRIKEINLAKLGAYFALSFSSILWVRTPRVCIIKDFENVVPKQPMDYIVVDENGEEHIEERIMDITLNCADGQGLIDPEFATLWAQDMNLDFIPSSFVCRSAFVKGNVVPFDFKEYARREGIFTITDRWGKVYNLEDIDVLISESQFKMFKYYTSWEEYLDYAQKGGIRWGVARYNKKYDDENVLANYQYIQVLKMTKEDIDELIQPTIDWIQKICSGDELYTTLFTLGCKDEDVDYTRYYSSAQANYSKALVKNKAFLQDGYVQRKIYQNIVECINRAKIGKIWVRGNYQFMISDPIAQCRSALGLPMHGIIPAECVYSEFWNRKGVTKLDLCRSPMVDKSEHNISSVFTSREAEEWFKYIHSGVIYSIYDVATIKHSDSDWDGDLCFSTDNPVFIRCAQTQYHPITYDKGAPPIQKNTMANRVKTDLRGFGTGVGGFSNCTTIIEAMKAIFKKETQSDLIEELTNRQKILRRIIGQEIDRIKGLEKPTLPSSWKKFEKINPEDTDAEKAEKYKHNSLVIHKKPYFFRYLYPELNKRFKQYENSYNLICKDTFGIKLKKLLAKPDKTEVEMNLVRRYQKYSPLIVSDCTMNILCKKFENIDFDIKFKESQVNMLPLFEDCGYEVNLVALKEIRECYRKYNNKRTVKLVESIFRDYSDDDIKEIYFNINEAIKIDIQQTLFSLGLDIKQIMFHIGVLSKQYTKFNWSFVWNMLEEQIVDLIPQGETVMVYKNDEGEEYLGQRYKLKNIFKLEGEENEEIALETIE